MWKIGQPRLFDLVEAEAALPLIKTITAEAVHRVEEYQERMAHLLLADPRRENLQNSYRHVIEQWKQKMENLGLFVEGLWQVKFDVGGGFLCWEHPQTRIGHFVEKSLPWEKRQRLSIVINEYDPDWAH